MINKDFLYLLRAGVTGVAEGNIGDVDWKEVELLAAKQGVLPIVFDGYQRYFEQKGLQAPVEVKLRWYAATQQYEKHYEKHLNAIQTLSSFYAQHGLRMMILKGYSLSLCYPHPNHRPCGDMDIYQFGEYKKGDELLRKEGVSIDVERHHHTTFNWKGVMVENHYDLICVYDYISSRRFEKVFKALVKESTEKVGDVTIPAPTFHALFLIRHAGGHFASTSITIRHLLDYYFFCQKYGDQVDWQVVEKYVKEFGLSDFYRCQDICLKKLLEDEPEKNYDKLAERMWNDILHPEFDEKEPLGWKKLPFMWRRWWKNRWKHPMVFPDSQLSQLLSLIYCHIIPPETTMPD